MMVAMGLGPWVGCPKDGRVAERRLNPALSLAVLKSLLRLTPMKGPKARLHTSLGPRPRFHDQRIPEG